MKVKTSDLIGPALDWAVAKCRGFEGLDGDEWLVRDGIADMPLSAYTTSTDWAQGGPIFDSLVRRGLRVNGYKCRYTTDASSVEVSINGYYMASGPTILLAGMRCFVCANLGVEVDVPDELFKG